MKKIFETKKCIGLQKTVEKLISKNNREILDTLIINDKEGIIPPENKNSKKKKCVTIGKSLICLFK